MKKEKTIFDRAKDYADSKYLQSNHHYDRQSCEEGYHKGYEAAKQELSSALPSDEEIEEIICKEYVNFRMIRANAAIRIKQQILDNIK